MPGQIILIRHGETAWNRSRRYCGSSDVVLSARGNAQAGGIKRRLKGRKIEAIYASGMRRALQFKEAVFGKKKCRIVPGLEEIGFGALEGLTHEEAMRAHPRIYRLWLADPTAATLPGAEPFRRFAARVKKGFAKILAENGEGTSVVFTHGGPIRVILASLLGLPLKRMLSIPQKNAAFNVLKHDGRRLSLLMLNGKPFRG